MDGVITDSEPLQVEAEKWVCEKFNIVVPETAWSGFKGKTNRDIFSYICEHFVERPLSVDALIEAKRGRYIEIAQRKLALIDGSKDFLIRVRQNIPLIGLATSSSSVVQAFVFDRYDLHGYFDVVVTGDQVVRGKPHPEPYLCAMEKLGVFPEETIVIEDSDNGIISAKAAGCAVIGITTSFPREILKSCGADYVVDSFGEMDELFHSITTT